MVQVDGQPRRSCEFSWGRLRGASWALILALALLWEARTTHALYFGDYAAGLADGGYSITLDMARAIDDMADDGVSYIKVMPYWYDGNAVRALLTHEDQSWHNELVELRRDLEPFVGPPGKFMVILHPGDTASLEMLLDAFPQGVFLRRTRPATRQEPSRPVALITFYGERR